MSMNNGLGIQIPIDFTSFTELDAQFRDIVQKLNKAKNNKVQLEAVVNADELQKIINTSFKQMSIPKLTFNADGTPIKEMIKYVNELNQVLTVTKTIDTEEGTGRMVKNLSQATLESKNMAETQKALYSIMVKAEKEVFDYKTKSLGAEGDLKALYEQRVANAEKIVNQSKSLIESNNLVNDSIYQQVKLGEQLATSEAKYIEAQTKYGVKVQQQYAKELEQLEKIKVAKQQAVEGYKTKGTITNSEYKKALDEISKINLSNTQQQLAKVNAEIERMGKQENLNKLKDNFKSQLQGLQSKGFLNSSTYTDLLNRIEKLDLSSSQRQINGITSALENMSKSESKVKSLDRTIAQYEQKLSELKSNSSAFSSKADIKALEDFENALKKIRAERKALKDNQQSLGGNTLTEKNAIESLNELSRAYQKVSGIVKETNNIVTTKSNLSTMLEKFKNDGILASQVFTDLQKEISKLNTKSSQEQIKSLTERIKNLGTQESQVVKVQKAIDTIEKNIANFKTTFPNFGDSNSISQVQSYENELQKLKTLLESLKSGQLTITSPKLAQELENASNSGQRLKTTLESTAKSNKELEKINTTITELKGKLNQLNTNKIIDTSAISQLEAKLNSINLSNLEQAKADLSSLSKEIQSLGKNEKPIVDLEGKINSFTQSLNKMKTDFANATVTGNATNNLTTDDRTVQQYQALETEISKLIQLKQQLASGQFIDGNVISQQIKSASLSMTELTNATNASIQADKKRQTEINQSNAVLSEAIVKLQAYQKALQNSKSTSSSNKLLNEINQQIVAYEQLRNTNKVLDQEEKARIKSTTSEISKQTNTIIRENNKRITSQGKVIKSEGKLVNTIKSISMYAFGGSIVFASINQVKQAITNIVDIENSMTSLRRVYQMTDETAKEFQSTMSDLAYSLGSTSTNVIDTITAWKKLGYTIEEAKQLGESSIKLDLAGDVNNIDTTTEDLVAIMRGFDLSADKITETTDKLNETANNYAVSVVDIADALKTSSATLKVAGNDLSQSIALTTVGTEVLQNPAKVGNALKTISMRIRGVAEEGGELDAKLGSIVKQLTGVDLTDANGQFKTTYDIFKEIGAVWDTLSGQEQALLGEKLFGKQNATTGFAILDNYERLEEVLQTTKESEGSVDREYARYMDTTTAKLNQLKESMTEFWSNFVDSDMTKGAVDTMISLVQKINSCVDAFGSLPSVITTVVGAMTMFNSKFRENVGLFVKSIPFISSFAVKLENLQGDLAKQTSTLNNTIMGQKFYVNWLQKHGQASAEASKKLAGLYRQMLLAKTGMVALKVATIALNTALSMGLSLIVSSIVSKITEKIDELITTKEELEELNSTFNEDTGAKISNNNQAQDLLDQYKELNEELKNLKKGTGDYQTKEEELKTVQDQLLEIYPQINEALDGNFDGKDKLIKKTQELIDKENELNSVEARKILDKNNVNDFGDFEKKVSEYKTQLNKLKAFEKFDDSGKAEGEVTWQDETWGGEMSQYLYAGSDELNEGIQKSSKESQRLEEALKALASSFSVLDKSGTKYAGVSKKINDLMKELGITATDTAKSLSKLDTSAQKEDRGNNLEASQQQFSNTVKNIKQYKELIKDINENGLNADNQLELLDLYPELATHITDSAYCVDFLNQKIEEEGKVQKEAYYEMIKDDANYFNQKIKNSEAYANYIQTALNGMNKINAKYYEANKDRMKAELANAKTLAESRLIIEKNLTGSMAELYKQYMTTTIKGLHGEDVEVGFNWEHGVPETEAGKEAQARYHQALDEYNALQEAIKNMSVDLGGDVDIAIGDVGGTLKPDSSSKTDRDYSVDDLESLYDRYLKINTAIDKVSGNLEILKTKQDNLVGSDYLKSLESEINSYKEQQKLIKQKISEQDKERWDLRVKLDSAGFRFDDNDINSQILNYQSQLKALTDGANAMADSDEKSAEAKKKAQERVKDLNEAIKDYNTLISETIPNTQKEWESLNNSIKEVYETIVDTVAKQENNISEVISDHAKRNTEAITKEIDKQIEAINKKYDAEDREKDLLEKRNNASDLLEEMSKYENATDIKGRNKYLELKEQYDEAMSELNDTIRDQQKEDIINALEDQKTQAETSLEEFLEPENLSKIVAKAIETGYVDMGNEMVSLKAIMQEYFKENEVGYTNILSQQKEWLDNLANAQAMYKNINDYSAKLGMGNISSVQTSGEMKGLSSPTIDNSILNSSSANIVVNIPIQSGANVNAETIAQMQNVANQAVKSALKEYNSKLNY